MDLARSSPSSRSGLGIAHVPEGRGLFFGLTVAEHFRVGPRARAPGRGGRVRVLPEPARPAAATRGPALRRRAADARGRAGARTAPEAPAARRAEPRARARDRGAAASGRARVREDERLRRAARRAARPSRARGRRPRLRARPRRDRARERRRAAARRTATCWSRAIWENTRRPSRATAEANEEDEDERTEPQRSARDGLEPGRTAAQLAGRAERLSGSSGRVHQLARRAARVAEHLRPLRPVVPHGRPRGRGPGRARPALAPRRQQLRRLHRRPGEAVRAVHPGRLRDRRRDPVRARRRSLQPRRPQPGAELDHLPRRDRRLRRERRARPADCTPLRRTAEVVPVPGSGAERDEGDRAGARREPAGAQVLPDDDADARRQDGARAPSRHGRPARLGAVRPLGRP